MSTPIKIVLVALTALAGFYAQDIWSYLNPAPTVSLQEHCLLSTQPCERDKVVAVISQDTTQPLLPFTIDVSWPHSNAQSLSLNLQGYEMDMGLARFALAQNGSGHYQSEILLPACTMESMTWIGQLSDGQHSVNVAIRMAR